VENMTGSKSTLTKNALKKFILRLDFGPLDSQLVGKIVELISNQFERVEKRVIQGFRFEIKQKDAQIQNQDTHDILCISEVKGITLTFSGADGAIIFESTTYKNKDTYLGVLNSLISALETLNFQTESKRIGMRFVNEFPCDKPTKIGMIFSKSLSSITRGMLEAENASRAIAMIETTTSDYKSRIHYGVVNKYYPEPIKVFDLLLDIDLYINTPSAPCDLDEITKTLNKAAYNLFLSCINDKYLIKMK
jgi:uncharacterized protein (TIGR04255 family)